MIAWLGTKIFFIFATRHYLDLGFPDIIDAADTTASQTICLLDRLAVPVGCSTVELPCKLEEEDGVCSVILVILVDVEEDLGVSNFIARGSICEVDSSMIGVAIATAESLIADNGPNGGAEGISSG